MGCCVLCWIYWYDNVEEEVTKMLCSSCGKIIPDDAQFCRYCGSPISKNSSLKNQPVQEVTTDKDISQDKMTNETTVTTHESKSAFKGYIILCLIALAIAGGFMYLRNINNTSFDESSLRSFTCIGESSKLSILTPFDLKDENPGPLDETIAHMLYKMGASGNFRVEVVGIKYTVDMSAVSNSDIMEYFIESLKEEKSISNMTKGDLINTTINGIPCSKQIINYRDRDTQYSLESVFLALKQRDEIWIVSTAYKKADKKAKTFSDSIINSIDVK